MYTGSATARDVQTEPPQEQLSSINEQALKGLSEAVISADRLLRKVRGSQPEPTNQESKLPERTAMSDAYVMRGLANEVVDKLNELHRIIGHE